MSFEIDNKSLLVRVPGRATLASVEEALVRDGLTLGLSPEQTPWASPIAEWLASGARGSASVFVDPADHLVAGLEATLTNGKHIEVRPSPRRAVGPDLMALFVGAGERFGSIERAWLRVHVRSAPRVRLTIAEGIDLDPPMSKGEVALVEAMAACLADAP